MVLKGINHRLGGGFLGGLAFAALLGAGWAFMSASAGFRTNPAMLAAGTTFAGKTPAGATASINSRPASAPVPVPAQASQPLASQAQPLQHARKAGMQTCLPAIDELSRQVIDGEHTALSTWHQQDADGRLFQSLVGLHYASAVAPHALSVLVTTPRRGGAAGTSPCDGATVQVHPSKLSCGQIATSLQKPTGAPPPAPPLDLKGVKILQTSGATRVALVPLQPQGCIVVGLGVYFAR